MYLDINKHVQQIFNAASPEHEYRKVVYTNLLPKWKALQLARACEKKLGFVQYEIVN